MVSESETIIIVRFRLLALLLRNHTSKNKMISVRITKVHDKVHDFKHTTHVKRTISTFSKRTSARV